MKRRVRNCHCPACADVVSPGLRRLLHGAAIRLRDGERVGFVVDEPMRLAEAIEWSMAHRVPCRFAGLFPADQNDGIKDGAICLLVAAREKPPWVDSILHGLQEPYDETEDMDDG